VACVNGVNGLILLPDNWICPEDIVLKVGFAYTKGEEYYAQHQVFDEVQWKKIEQNGAVFLPAAGVGFRESTADVRLYGYYWSSSSEAFFASAYALCFTSNDAQVEYNLYSSGYSVRLVKIFK
jgi:hypothetical protein